MEFASHLGKKLLLPGLLDVMLCDLDMWDPQENDCSTCLKVRWSLKGSYFMKESARYSAGYRRK